MTVIQATYSFRKIKLNDLQVKTTGSIHVGQCNII